MKKYKICVYAICKNEEQFVDRWVDSMQEADEIIVLDTGSKDKTVEKLRKRGVKVTTKIVDPWRFDVARNTSLDLVPKDCDICVCTDLDELFDKGWRKHLENAWQPNTTRLRYTYHWNLDDKNQPVVSFYLDKIHSRTNYQWKHPVHEVLTCNKQEQFVTAENIVLKHYPDKKKSRASYLPLLELSVKEDPTDDRNMHYLGREYMYYERWNEAIDTLIRHLNLKKATWKDERCASMRFIARCYKNLKRYEEARLWTEKAIKEAPYLRDGYMERAVLEYELKNWDLVFYYCSKALAIKTNQKTYINEPFSLDSSIYDFLSLSSYYMGNYHLAKKLIDEAIHLKPEEKRLQENKKWIEKAIEKEKK